MQGTRLITVENIEGDRFVARVRGHEIIMDQPVEDGGTDSGPSPTEVFVASIAACVGHYARRYLARHELPQAGLAVRATFEMHPGRPARIAAIAVDVELPDRVPAERLPALLAVASKCTLHNTLEDAPTVKIRVTEGVRA